MASHVIDRLLATPARKADQNIKPTKNKRTKIKTTETYGTTFDPGQQHLYTLVRNKLILAGDELKYNGKSDVHCTILVSVSQVSSITSHPLCINLL